MIGAIFDLLSGHPFSIVRLSSCNDGSFAVYSLNVSSFDSEIGSTFIKLILNSSEQMSLASSGRYARDRVSAMISSLPGQYFTIIIMDTFELT